MTQPRKIHVAEYLDLDVDSERWSCHSCGHDIGDARDNYKKGLLIHERDPGEVHPPLIEGAYTFAPNPEWIRILEFYCPGCGRQVETEYLPPGHPITHDTEIDLDSLQRKLADGALCIDAHGKLEVTA
ncbi:acetone carboxylase subunit gamma [Pseudonocardia sp. CA-107938]|uniref:acetone carboxylase subunit gamma n=1 Tax=Pseudonocardia sp. CA-107938 TaxID=3240021 RepID=UPI003D8BB0FC